MHFAFRLVENGQRGIKDIKIDDVEGLYFQLPNMHANFQAFPELVFIDTSVKQKCRGLEDFDDGAELFLVVISGLNNEGQNIIFGCGILKELTREALCWLLDNFRKSNCSSFEHAIALERDITTLEDEIVDPEVIISDCSEPVNTAVEVVFTHKTSHLYC